MKTGLALLAAVLIPLAGWAAPPAPLVDAMRGATPIAEEAKPPLLFNVENKDVRRIRAYTMRPPTIPHKIDGYSATRAPRSRKARRCRWE